MVRYSALTVQEVGINQQQVTRTERMSERLVSLVQEDDTGKAVVTVTSTRRIEGQVPLGERSACERRYISVDFIMPFSLPFRRE